MSYVCQLSKQAQCPTGGDDDTVGDDSEEIADRIGDYEHVNENRSHKGLRRITV